MKRTPRLDDVVAFVREFSGMRSVTPLPPSSRIDADLGITGDDAVELLKAAEQRFGVDFGDDFGATFGLRPGQVLFGSEGLGVPGLDLVRGGRTHEAAIRDLRVIELHNAILQCAIDGPESPFLVMRSGTAFWVESEPFSNASATLQAFQEGCYNDVDLIDGSGGCWPVAQAVLREPVPALAWLRPAKRLKVKLRLGPRREADLGDTVRRLEAVLRAESEFGDHLAGSLEEFVAEIRACTSLAELISVLQRRAP